MSTGNAKHTKAVEAAAHEARMTIIGTVILSHELAHRAGLASTDLWCLSVLYLTGTSTPGKLAAAMGLSSGAMTHIIDRLEQRGYLKRDRDPGDRRRVTVTATGMGDEKPPPIFASLGAAWRRLLAGYSESDLTVLLDLFTRAHQITRAEIDGLTPDHRPPTSA
nr:MarR family transcriptional regulator [Kibdelosporangium sp. MJ126-NF4]CEL13127.1 Transcriptional regulator, MarR family [Kibdelosporangium sp. MJ126-NF4]CTQ98816.1 Transcriptional regulator, MarR family [Kibdelosporangium sp. MJ126-NF4]